MRVGRRTIAGLLVGCCYAPVLHSDVVRDGSIGPDASVQPQGPDYVIPETMGEFAPGSSANLFHSFGEFSLSSLQSATFTGPDAVQNILARVTGGVPSTIDGLLSSQIADADLFLINPQGVMFGENARLDVNGSFYATTADGVRLGTSGDFAATNPGSTVLSVEPPAAFYFLGNGPVAPVMVNESLLIVPEGETLGLVGGDITVLGQNHSGEPVGEFSTLVASGGKVVLSSVASAGEVALDGTPTGFDQLGNIHLAAPSSLNANLEGGNLVIDVAGDPAGTAVIRGGQLVMEQGAAIGAGITGNTDHPGVGVDIDLTGDFTMYGYSEIGSSTFGLGDAGDILIRVGGDFAMLGNPDSPAYGGFGNNVNIGSRSFGFVDVNGDKVGGDAGIVDISARSILIDQLAYIQSNTFTDGNADLLRLTADRIDIQSDSSFAFVSSGVFDGGTGNSGTIEINTGDLFLRMGNGAGFVGITVQVSSSATGNPDAGDIFIDADRIEVLDGSEISATVFTGAGSGGDITINADSILLSGVTRDADGDPVFTFDFFPSGIFAAIGTTFDNFGGTSATAGTITINAGELTLADGAQIRNAADFPSSGNAGDTFIDVDDLVIRNSAGILNDAFGFGVGGFASITADSIVIEGPSMAPTYIGTGIFSQTGASAAGSGEIRVVAGTLDILGGGSIGTNTFGLAPGGPLSVEADVINISGFDDLPPNPTFPNGFRNVASSIASDSLIFVPGLEGGPGGNVTVRAGELNLSDRGLVTARTFTFGSGGDVTIDARAVTIQGGAAVTVASTGTGDAGEIVLDAELLTLVGGSISARADFADGGNILIDSDRTRLHDSDITATVGGGVGDGGNVTLSADDYLLLDRSDITANAVGGRGGNIDITTYALIMDNESTLSASSQLGVDGTVAVSSPENEVEDAAVVATPEFTDAASLLKAQCSAAVSGQSSLVVSRGDGLPESPEGLLSLRDPGSLDVAAIPPRMLLAALECFAP